MFYANSARCAVLLIERSNCVPFADLLFAKHVNWSSYLATTVRSAPVVSLRNAT